MTGQPYVVAIFVAPRAGAPMAEVAQVEAAPHRGLAGDRYFDLDGNGATPPRAGRARADVTLIEAEVIDHLRLELGIGLEPGDSRRNILTRGIRLDGLVGTEFSVGEVRLVGTELCEPCASLVRGRENAELLRGLAHRGGLCARILTPGAIGRGDSIVAFDTSRASLPSAVHV